MSCYYHQDWMHEVESKRNIDLWASFFSTEIQEVSKELELDIKELLTESDVEILKTLEDYQTGGKCWSSSVDSKDWLLKLYEYCKSYKT